MYARLNLWYSRKSSLLALFLMVVLAPAVDSTVDPATQLEAARGVLERVIPGRADEFRLELVPSDGPHDFFEIESRDKIVLRGPNGVSLCSALNWYLKYFCNADFGLYGEQLTLPDPLPQLEDRYVVVSPHEYRYFFNYCCFGYSLPWWDWSQWERCIDWMALNGINMPLAVTGQEAVWQNVLRRFGLSDEQIFEFLAGPPYLPFGWMGCLDGWGGPLPQHWIDRHAELEKQILERERELGMTPVLQGFTGHIPPAIKQKYPNTTLHEIKWIEWQTNFVESTDPLFHEFGKAFIEEQTRLYGTDHLYDADTFIEMSPPSNDTTFLYNLGMTIYNTMAAADPEAIWIMQGWIFFNNPNFWKPPQSKAFLGGVPDDRMILLDLFCDERPVWNLTEAFYGKPWLWCIIQSFGDNVRLNGPLAQIDANLHAAMKDPKRGKLRGIGVIQEGLDDNPVIFELMTEEAWRNAPVNMSSWVRDYAVRRYGQADPHSERAWQLLLETVYSGPNRSGSTVVGRPGLGTERSWTIQEPPYDGFKLAEAAAELLQCADRFGAVDAYQYDLVNVVRQTLSNIAGPLVVEVVNAWFAGDRETFLKAKERYLQLIRDMDTLLATREEFLLGKWVEDAKRWGETEEERNTFEYNARNVVTLWGARDSVLHEYAHKEWSGLLRGFYLQRWQKFFEKLEPALGSGTFDGEAFTKEIQLWEEQWTRSHEPYSAVPEGDPVAVAKAMIEKYKGLYVRETVSHLGVGKKAKASRVHQQFTPDKAVDGIIFDRNSSWQARQYPAWWQVDLGRRERIGAVQVYPYWDGARYYQYTVEVSMDGKSWTMVADRRENTNPAMPQGDLCRFDPREVRYVRVNMLYNSANPGVHLVEVKVLPAE